MISSKLHYKERDYFCLLTGFTILPMVEDIRNNCHHANVDPGISLSITCKVPTSNSVLKDHKRGLSHRVLECKSIRF